MTRPRDNEYPPRKIKTKQNKKTKPKQNQKNKNKNNLSSRFCRFSRLHSKNKIKWKDAQMLGPCQKTKKKKKQLLNMKMTVIPIVVGILGTVPKKIGWGLEKLDIGWRIETMQTSALLFGQNTETSSGDQRRLAVTQTPVKNHQLK